MEYLGISGWEVIIMLATVLLVAAAVVGVYRLVRKASADGARDALAASGRSPDVSRGRADERP